VRVRVLGSAAGGGFPQWNCNCRNCDGLRRGRIRARPRTQSSIALSADGQAEGLQYFQSRVIQARRDVDYGLALTLEHFRTRKQQERALHILQFKLDVLWSMLDAMQTAYGLPQQRHAA
jgi:coenzyme PQQ biosynthesis protein C